MRLVLLSQLASSVRIDKYRGLEPNRLRSDLELETGYLKAKFLRYSNVRI